jgi:glycosyltransferase involved in cell wall biosynthesis
MIADPRVTYLLATRNREKILPKAFENFREFIDPSQDEFIIVDGASSDHSLEIINQNRDLITTLISEPDKGEAHAFNKGLLRAKGKIIKPLTDDDYFYPEAIKKATNLLLQDEDLDAILCAGRFMSKNTDGSDKIYFQNFVGVDSFTSSVKNIFLYGSCGLGLFIKRDILSLVGLFDTSYFSIDSEYIARLIEFKVKFKFYRIHLFDHHTQPLSGVSLGMEKIKRDYLRICLRSRLYKLGLSYWMIWNVRSKIPTPFRYLWKTEDKKNISVLWNDEILA